MVIYGITLWGGALCCNATLVSPFSPVSRDGQPQGRSADEDRAALATAMRRKEATYPELPTVPSASREPWLSCAIPFASAGCAPRPLSAIPRLQPEARRWWTQLSVTVQRATALWQTLRGLACCRSARGHRFWLLLANSGRHLAADAKRRGKKKDLSALLVAARPKAAQTPPTYNFDVT